MPSEPPAKKPCVTDAGSPLDVDAVRFLQESPGCGSFVVCGDTSPFEILCGLPDRRQVAVDLLDTHGSKGLARVPHRGARCLEAIARARAETPWMIDVRLVRTLLECGADANEYPVTWEEAGVPRAPYDFRARPTYLEAVFASQRDMYRTLLAVTRLNWVDPRDGTEWGLEDLLHWSVPSALDETITDVRGRLKGAAPCPPPPPAMQAAFAPTEPVGTAPAVCGFGVQLKVGDRGDVAGILEAVIVTTLTPLRPGIVRVLLPFGVLHVPYDLNARACRVASARDVCALDTEGVRPVRVFVTHPLTVQVRTVATGLEVTLRWLGPVGGPPLRLTSSHLVPGTFRAPRILTPCVDAPSMDITCPDGSVKWSTGPGDEGTITCVRFLPCEAGAGAGAGSGTVTSASTPTFTAHRVPSGLLALTNEYVLLTGCLVPARARVLYLVLQCSGAAMLAGSGTVPNPMGTSLRRLFTGLPVGTEVRVVRTFRGYKRPGLVGGGYHVMVCPGTHSPPYRVGDPNLLHFADTPDWSEGGKGSPHIEDENNDMGIAEALELAGNDVRRNKDVRVVVVGTHVGSESRGLTKTGMRIPGTHRAVAFVPVQAQLSRTQHCLDKSHMAVWGLDDYANHTPRAPCPLGEFGTAVLEVVHAAVDGMTVQAVNRSGAPARAGNSRVHPHLRGLSTVLYSVQTQGINAAITTHRGKGLYWREPEDGSRVVDWVTGPVRKAVQVLEVFHSEPTVSVTQSKGAGKTTLRIQDLAEPADLVKVLGPDLTLQVTAAVGESVHRELAPILVPGRTFAAGPPPGCDVWPSKAVQDARLGSRATLPAEIPEAAVLFPDMGADAEVLGPDIVPALFWTLCEELGRAPLPSSWDVMAWMARAEALVPAPDNALGLGILLGAMKAVGKDAAVDLHAGWAVWNRLHTRCLTLGDKQVANAHMARLAQTVIPDPTKTLCVHTFPVVWL